MFFPRAWYRVLCIRFSRSRRHEPLLSLGPHRVPRHAEKQLLGRASVAPIALRQVLGLCVGQAPMKICPLVAGLAFSSDPLQPVGWYARVSCRSRGILRSAVHLEKCHCKRACGGSGLRAPAAESESFVIAGSSPTVLRPCNACMPRRRRLSAVLFCSQVLMPKEIQTFLLSGCCFSLSCCALPPLFRKSPRNVQSTSRDFPSKNLPRDSACPYRKLYLTRQLRTKGHRSHGWMQKKLRRRRTRTKQISWILMKS